ncbi:hypothetical protein HMPREF1092_03199 [Clostridium thermobutyricum]|uniref:Uncharacterized protein n=1 Tax=Clostridium thermobutyricum TaxID=29372 RepID=N9XU12_9CLOT|nr:hypothetical protein [Clostridium thermobutyricum]ENY99458.1 hypothetical protein HMPREF1092_03199 [Clostridium thermobutyricum]
MKNKELTDDEFYNRVIIGCGIGLCIFAIILGIRIFYVTRPSYMAKFNTTKTNTSSISNSNSSNNVNSTQINTHPTSQSNSNSVGVNEILKGNNGVDFAFDVLDNLKSYVAENGGNDIYIEDANRVTRSVTEHRGVISNINEKILKENITDAKALSSLVGNELIRNRGIRKALLNKRNLGMTMLYSIEKNDLICTIKISHK